LFKTFKACFLVAESKAMMRELKDNVVWSFEPNQSFVADVRALKAMM